MTSPSGQGVACTYETENDALADLNDGHLADGRRSTADPSSAAAAPHVTSLPQRGKGYCRFYGTRNGECGVSSRVLQPGALVEL